MKNLKIQSFIEKYIELRPRVVQFLNKLQALLLLSPDDMDEKTCEIFSEYSDDEQILFDTLYYTGRDIYCEDLRLSESQSEAKNDVAESCVLNMERDNLEFGEPKNDTVQLQDKMASRIIQFITISMQYLDYNE